MCMMCVLRLFFEVPPSCAIQLSFVVDSSSVHNPRRSCAVGLRSVVCDPVITTTRKNVPVLRRVGVIFYIVTFVNQLKLQVFFLSQQPFGQAVVTGVPSPSPGKRFHFYLAEDPLFVDFRRIMLFNERFLSRFKRHDKRHVNYLL